MRILLLAIIALRWVLCDDTDTAATTGGGSAGAADIDLEVIELEEFKCDLETHIYIRYV